MERLTSLYAIMNSMENLRFDKEEYFHVLVFYRLFYKRNRKHFFRVPIVIETLVEVWEDSKFSSDAFFLRTYTYGVLRTRKLVHWRVLSTRT